MFMFVYMTSSFTFAWVFRVDWSVRKILAKITTDYAGVRRGGLGDAVDSTLEKKGIVDLMRARHHVRSSI